MNPFAKELKAYSLSALFGCMGGVITIGMIWLLHISTAWVWEDILHNDIDDPSRTPYVFMTFLIAALVAGYFAKKYTKPLIGMDEVVAQIIENGKIRWQDTGRAFANGLLSIASGASLGPEAPSAFISAGTSSFIAEKTKQPRETAKVINISSVSGMLGALLSSPFLAPVLVAASAKNSIKSLQNILTYSTIASAFGVGTFFALFHTVAVINIGLPAYPGAGLKELIQALVIGFLAAVFLGILFKITAPIIAAITEPLKNKPFVLAITGGTIAAFIAFCAPLTMFSGQYTIPALLEKSADFGIVLLFLLAIAKLFSTLLLLKSGFFGGPIFPIIFVGATLGIIVADIANLPLTLAVAATITGLLTIAMRQPLSAALLAIGILGVNVTSVVAIAAAGAALLLTLQPQTEDN
jgi:H+/Cl- antiporter ClcA